jgi:hypothetical protein
MSWHPAQRQHTQKKAPCNHHYRLCVLPLQKRSLLRLAASVSRAWNSFASLPETKFACHLEPRKAETESENCYFLRLKGKNPIVRGRGGVRKSSLLMAECTLFTLCNYVRRQIECDNFCGTRIEANSICAPLCVNPRVVHNRTNCALLSFRMLSALAKSMGALAVPIMSLCGRNTRLAKGWDTVIFEQTVIEWSILPVIFSP